MNDWAMMISKTYDAIGKLSLRNLFTSTSACNITNRNAGIVDLHFPGDEFVVEAFDVSASVVDQFRTGL